MKKSMLLILCLAVTASGAFALDKALEKAVGGGVLFNYARTIGVDEEPGYKNKEILSRQGMGGFAFFGLARFFEFDLGFIYKNPIGLEYRYIEGGHTDSMELDLDNAGIGSVPALQLGFYFKYPFSLSDKLFLFPTLGLDYELTLAGKADKWWDDFWIRSGAGLDIFLYERTFLLIHAIYGFGIVVARDYSFFNSKDFNSKYSHGLLIKAGIGFTL